MKVSTVKPEFQPVVITLETQEEVDQMFALANFNSISSKVDITSKLFDELESIKVGDYQKKDGTTARLYKVEK